MNDVIIWWSMFLQFTIDALGFFPITEKVFQPLQYILLISKKM